jgi:hypothetical protein
VREHDNHLGQRGNGDQQIRIVLRYNAVMRDWSVKINDQVHEHVTSDIVEALVECQLIVAETSLIVEQYWNPSTLVAQRAI